MSYSVKIFNNISEACADEWDMLASSPYNCFSFLEIVEEITTIEIIPRYILIYEKQKLVSTVTAYIQKDAEYYTFEQAVYGKYYKLIRAFLFRLNPCLMSYNPCVGTTMMEISAKAVNREKICQIIVETMEQLARSEKISQFGFLNVSDEDRVFRNILNNNGYACTFSSYGIFFKVKWHSFEEYLMSLPGNRRAMVRKDLRKHAEAGMVISRATELGDDGPLISRLFNENFMKYQGRKSKLPVDFLEKLFSKLRGKIGLVIDKKDGQIVTCSMYFTGQGKMWLNKVAKDDTLAGNSRSLFVTATSESIKIAIENGYHYLDLGSGAYKYKLLRGAGVRPLYHYTKNSNFFINQLQKLMFKRLSKRKESKHYNQIKDYLMV